MTYQALEESVDSGKPVELLKITAGAGNDWYYTTGDTTTFLGNTYVQTALKHSSVNVTSDVTKQDLTIQIPYDSPIGELYRLQAPSTVVSITLYEKHHGDSEYIVKWKGRVINVKWDKPWLSLTCESVGSSLRRIGVRLYLSTQCPHTLYDPDSCGVDKELHKRSELVNAINGRTITITGLIGEPTDFFAGGYIQYTSATTGIVEYCTARNSVSVSGEVILKTLPLGLTPLMVVDIFPGCDRTTTTCDQKFSNHLNNGSTSFMPTKNPFAGSPVF